MGNAETPFLIKEDNAAVTFDSLFQMRDGLLHLSLLKENLPQLILCLGVLRMSFKDCAEELYRFLFL